MTKKLIFLLLTVLIVFSMTVPAFAAEGTDDVRIVQTEDGYTIYHFEDGSMLSISPAILCDVDEENPVNTLATAKTVTYSREATSKDSSGNLEWKYVLTGTFSYVNGVSATCTNASYTQTIYANGWTFSNGSATKSGATAIGKGTFTKRVLLFTKDYNVDISLTCDIYGNVT